MAVQDPTIARAEFAFEEADMIDGGPAVSWGAIFAGALSASALAFVLLAVGTAFGLSLASPWNLTGSNAGEAAATAGIWAAIFLVFVHVITSGIGGYLAGRLRSKVIGVRGDETYFRDTAHGLVVWALGVLTAILMITWLATAAARGGLALGAAGSNAASEAASGAMAASGMSAADGAGGVGIGYFVDSLFRPGPVQPSAATGDTSQPASPGTPPNTTLQSNPARQGDARTGREEVGRLLRMALDGDISPEDRAYVTQLVVQETGLPPEQAGQRVDQVIERARAARAEATQSAKQAADAARQAGMYAALWGAVTMLVGAFSAALAATRGGRARDL
jgi:hypothetical protein